MTREIITSGGTYLAETGLRQGIGADGTFYDETSGAGGAGTVNLVLSPLTFGLGISSPAITVSAGSVAFAFTAPAALRVFQRNAGVATIAVAGTYSSGTPATIQARLVLDGTNTPVTGFDWATVVASPSGGAFSFSFASVPQGGMYNVQIRDSATPSLVTVSSKFGVGVLVAIIGQSSAYRQFRNGDSTLTPNANLSIQGNIASGGWMAADTATMNGAIATGNSLVTALALPVGLLDYAWDGSGLLTPNLGGQWLASASSANFNAYTAFKNGVNAIGGKLEAVIWVQGSTEAKLQANLVSADKGQVGYYNGLTALFNLMRTDFAAPNLPIVIGFEGLRTSGAGTDVDVEMVRAAQAQKSGEVNCYRVERMDLPLVDGIHHTPAGYGTLGLRQANAVKYALGLIPQYRGPHIVSAVRISATVFDLTLAHGAGTDFTPGGGITGLRVMDGATEIAVSTCVRTSATKIRVTLSSAPAALPNFGYLYGNVPNISGIIKDNSALALPMEYIDGVTASGGLATTVTFSVVDEFGVAVTGLTGLDYAFFDQSRLSQLAAPVKVGTDLAISGGSGTINITGVTSLAPGSTGYIRWGDSAGVKSGGGPVVVS